MMPLFFLFVLCLMGLAVFAAVRRVSDPDRPGILPVYLTGLLAVLSVLILFRPDEQIESGEDPAAYFHVAQSLARTGSLGGADPALSELPREERALFRYGHAGFSWTKDTVFWAEDEGFERVGPHFFPAYSFLLAGAMSLGGSYAAFWFSSLLAVGCGIIISLLVVDLTRRSWMGRLAYLLFLLHPITVWNARALRAEWPASFLLLLGILFFLHPGKKSPKPFLSGLVSGICLSSAMLFHMTAVYVFFPAVFAAGLRGKRNAYWGGWWSGAFAGVGLLVLQTIFVTDPYRMLYTLRDSSERRMVFLFGLGFLAAMTVLIRPVFQKLKEKPSVGRVTGGLMAGAYVILALLVLWTRDDLGHLPFLPEWSVAYISLTDFEGVMRMTSRIGLLFAMGGLFALCLKSETGRWLFFLLAPASMTIGWVMNYMFETRRMVTFLLPLLILAVSCMIDFLVRQMEFRRPVFRKKGLPIALGLGMGLLFIGLGIRGRMELYSTWNFRGLHGFYRRISDQIKPEADFLFAEYTQTAVPIEQKTGLPLLPLSWDYRSDEEVERIEAVWRRLVEDYPDRRHVLISPFRGSAIPGLAQEPLFTSSGDTRTLSRTRHQVPIEVTSWTRTLHVNRILPSGEAAQSVPYIREFRGSRLGIKGLANHMGRRAVELHGVRTDTGLTLATEPGRALTLFLVYPHGYRHTSPVLEGAVAQITELNDLWQAVVLQPDAESVRLQTGAYGFLVQVFGGEEEAPVPLPLPGTVEAFGLPSLDSQWLRADAAVIAPERAGLSRIWIYARHGRPADDPVSVHVTRGEANSIGEITLTPEWAWHVLELEHPEDALGLFHWIYFKTTPAFNPESPRFPEDLGFQISLFLVQPTE